jgi:hypothetical protein
MSLSYGCSKLGSLLSWILLELVSSFHTHLFTYHSLSLQQVSSTFTLV